MATQTTQAAYYDQFGGIDQIKLGPIELPEPGEGEVLIKMKAAGINPVDLTVLEGKFNTVVPAKFPVVPGWDLAGVVEKNGPGATRFAVGDEVMGYIKREVAQHGSFAERVVVPEALLAIKSAWQSWEQAGGLPLAGLTAYQAQMVHGKLKEGETVLILGASGGVGSMAIQLAKETGATVLAVAGADSADAMKKLGADHTLDYKAGPVGKQARKIAPDGVDLLLDAISGDTLKQSLMALKPGGRIISLLSDGKDLDLPAGVSFEHVMAHPSAPDLDHLRDVVDAGKLKVPVSATFPLAEVKQAFEQIASHHTAGKVVITM